MWFAPALIDLVVLFENCDVFFIGSVGVFTLLIGAGCGSALTLDVFWRIMTSLEGRTAAGCPLSHSIPLELPFCDVTTEPLTGLTLFNVPLE